MKKPTTLVRRDRAANTHTITEHLSELSDRLHSQVTDTITLELMVNDMIAEIAPEKVVSHPSRPFDHGLIPFLIRHRLGDESLLVTVERIMYCESLLRTNGSQKYAAKMLGVSERVYNYHAEFYKLRPKDQPKESKNELRNTRARLREIERSLNGKKEVVKQTA